MRKSIAMSLLLIVLGATACWARPSRKVVLQGTDNTRDLGGLPARGGHVKRGMIYRSGALCYITSADVEKLNRLGIRTIVDLRLKSEIAREGPDRRSLLAREVHLPMANSHGIHREAYISYMHDCRGLFRRFFVLLTRSSSYPLLFHCSAGKDRAGILAALLLMHLGTPRHVIVEDYMQSMRNSPALLVRRSWIQVVFNTVDAAGGIEPYLRGLGLTRKQLQRIRSLLVVPKK